MDGTELIITLTGTALVFIAILVEVEHKVIWEHHNKHHHPHKNQLLESLLKPNKYVYALNVYVLWPLVFMLGLVILFRQSP
jgi:hypothetical protein